MRLHRISRDQLPGYIRESIRELRHALVAGPRPKEFSNSEGMLPNASRGMTYVEFDVGEDRFGGRGKNRIVALVDQSTREFYALYYTNDHYGTEWTEVTW